MLDGQEFSGFGGVDFHPPKLDITKLLVFENKTSYNPVPLRTFSVNATQQNLNSLNNLISSQYSRTNRTNISPVLLANKLPSMVTLNHAPCGIADIPNGWDTHRYRFVLEVTSTNAKQNVTYYIQGYSNFADTSMTGLIDPNTWFIINTITTVYRNYSVHTGKYESRYGGTVSVIPDQNPSSVSTPTRFGLVRPYEVISHNRLARENLHTQVVSYVGDIDKNINTSNLSHISPISHFTDTINHVVTAMNNSKVSDMAVDIMSTASKLSQPDMILNNPFIRKLSNTSGQSVPYYFTLGDLTTMGANLREIITLITNAGYHTDSAVIVNPTLNAMKASVISNALPPLILDNLITGVKFSANNTLGQPAVYLTELNSYILPENVSAMATNLDNAIKDILLPQVSDANTISFSITVDCSLAKDVVVDISTFGEPFERYVLPLFANNVWCPVISDEGNKDLLIQDYSTTIESTCI